VEDGAGGKTRSDREGQRTFALAGLWERWRAEEAGTGVCNQSRCKELVRGVTTGWRSFWIATTTRPLARPDNGDRGLTGCSGRDPGPGAAPVARLVNSHATNSGGAGGGSRVPSVRFRAVCSARDVRPGAKDGRIFGWRSNRLSALRDGRRAAHAHPAEGCGPGVLVPACWCSATSCSCWL